MDARDIKRTLFSVSDFLSWQKQGLLDLNPPFQRRSVWKAGAKSYLVDTVVRGLPTPLIFLRERTDLDTLLTSREVIDGQQRLRTLIAFVDEAALVDFDSARDRFLVQRQHNPEIAMKKFSALDKTVREQILKYEFSTHVLPTSTEDRDVLSIFARLNSTGTPLNHQELRNAKFFGVFKTLMYQLAYEQLERWLDWGLFDSDGISRMAEVEMTSDLAVNMLDGLSGKSQPGLNRAYLRHDRTLPGDAVLAARFRLTMDAIQDVLGSSLRLSVFSSQIYFVTLFQLVYELLYGLGSGLEDRAPRSLMHGMREKLLLASRNLRSENVPEDVLDAVRRASADSGRRRTRLDYLTAAVA